MARPALGLSVAMALSGHAACGPSAGEPGAGLRVTTCGSDGPVRLLPHVVVAATMHDERLLAFGTTSLDLAAEHPPTLWSVGPCGEDPVTIHEGHGRLQIVDDLLLLCDDDSRVHRLDPTGARPPEEILQGVSCHFAATPAGLVAHDPVRQAVRLHPSPHDDGVQAITLAEDVPDRSPVPFHVDGSSLFVIDAQARLWRIELSTRTSVVVAEDVADLTVLPGTGRLLTEDVQIAAHGGQGSGRVRLVDLATGERQPLHAVGLPMKIRGPIAVGKATEAIDDDPDEARWGFGAFDLRTGARLDMPELDGLAITPPFLPDEEPFVLEAAAEASDGTTFHRWSDEAYGWAELATFDTCSAGRLHHGRLEVLVGCEDGDRALWLVELDGSGSTLAATDVSSPWLSRAAHIVWAGEPTHDVFGELWVAQLHDGPRWLLDDRALLLDTPTSPSKLDGDVLYTVHDSGRTGLWRSALP